MFVNLNLLQKQQLEWMFGRHFLQKSMFWMWLVNISVAGLATLMGWLNFYQSNRIDNLEKKLDKTEELKQSKELEIIELKEKVRDLKLKAKNDTLHMVYKD